MRQTNPGEVASYTGSVVAVLSSLTLTDIGIIVGILTALLTFWLNAFFMRRKDRRDAVERAECMRLLREKDKRDAEEHEARMRALGEVGHE